MRARRLGKQRRADAAQAHTAQHKITGQDRQDKIILISLIKSLLFILLLYPFCAGCTVSIFSLSTRSLRHRASKAASSPALLEASGNSKRGLAYSNRLPASACLVYFRRSVRNVGLKWEEAGLKKSVAHFMPQPFAVIQRSSFLLCALTANSGPGEPAVHPGWSAKLRQ